MCGDCANMRGCGVTTRTQSGLAHQNAHVPTIEKQRSDRSLHNVVLNAHRPHSTWLPFGTPSASRSGTVRQVPVHSEIGTVVESDTGERGHANRIQSVSSITFVA